MSMPQQPTIPGVTHVTGFHAPDGWRIKAHNEIVFDGDVLTHNAHGGKNDPFWVIDRAKLAGHDDLEGDTVADVKKVFMPRGGFILTPIFSQVKTETQWLPFVPVVGGQWPLVWRWAINGRTMLWNDGAGSGPIREGDLAVLATACGCNFDETMMFEHAACIIYRPEKDTPTKAPITAALESKCVSTKAAEAWAEETAPQKPDAVEAYDPRRHVGTAHAFNAMLDAMGKRPGVTGHEEYTARQQFKSMMDATRESMPVERLEKDFGANTPADDLLPGDVLSAGGKGASSKIPPYHLIPTVFLDMLANQAALGVTRKKKRSWNALSDNQDILLDREFVLERVAHVIRHAMLARDRILNGDFENMDTENDPAAVGWGGMFLCCAFDAMMKQQEPCKHGVT